MTTTTLSSTPSELALSQYSKDIKDYVSAVKCGDILLKGVVSGNQASDKDSIVCALALAYQLTITKCDKNEVYLPLVACRREDAVMRGETDLVFSKAGVDMNDLVFSDDEATPMLFDKAAGLTLVDHCNADADQFTQQGKDKVVRIVDHHKDEGAHLHVTGWARTIAKDYISEEGELKLVGSVGTIMAQIFLRDREGIAHLSRDGGAVAKLLYSLILIDTQNLDPAIGKTTEQDRASMNVMQHFADGLPSQDDWYQELSAAKTNYERFLGVSAETILRYDFKKFDSADGTISVGIASIPILLKDFVAKENWKAALERNMQEDGYHFYMVMTNVIGRSEEAGTQRQQLFYSKEQGRVADASAFFLNHPDTDYQLQGPLAIPGDPVDVIAYDQMNVTHSRKAVAPTAREFLDKVVGK